MKYLLCIGFILAVALIATIALIISAVLRLYHEEQRIAREIASMSQPKQKGGA